MLIVPHFGENNVPSKSLFCSFSDTTTGLLKNWCRWWTSFIALVELILQSSCIAAANRASITWLEIELQHLCHSNHDKLLFRFSIPKSTLPHYSLMELPLYQGWTASFDPRNCHVCLIQLILVAWFWIDMSKAGLLLLCPYSTDFPPWNFITFTRSWLITILWLIRRPCLSRMGIWLNLHNHHYHQRIQEASSGEKIFYFLVLG